MQQPSSKQIHSIQKEFPELDLTQSVLADVLQANRNNKKKTVEVLRSMNTEMRNEKELKIKELQEQFSCLSRDIIVAALESVKWEVEEAIIPLFNKMQEKQPEIAAEQIKQREIEQSKLPKPVEEVIVRQTTHAIEAEMRHMVLSQENHFAANPTAEKENPFKVTESQQTTPKEVATIVAKPEIVDTGNPVTIEWEVLSGKTSPSDWIGLFAPDQPNKNYLTYEWRGAQEKKGTLTFTAPSTFGVYEFRYIPYGSYQHIAISNKIKVGPNLDLTAVHDPVAKKIAAKWNIKSGNDYSRSWVGLFEKAETNNKNFISFQYAPKPYTEVTFDAPVKPGDYEFRFFAYSYVDVARSNTIKIEGCDTLEAEIGPDNAIIAKVSIVTMDPYYDGIWIGLYTTGEADNKNLKRYKYITERETTISFRAPDAGKYEVRLFAHKSYNVVLKSNSIEFTKA